MFNGTLVTVRTSAVDLCRRNEYNNGLWDTVKKYLVTIRLWEPYARNAKKNK